MGNNATLSVVIKSQELGRFISLSFIETQKKYLIININV